MRSVCTLDGKTAVRRLACVGPKREGTPPITAFGKQADALYGLWLSAFGVKRRCRLRFAQMVAVYLTVPFPLIYMANGNGPANSLE